jgi:hypothetical protein
LNEKNSKDVLEPLERRRSPQVIISTFFYIYNFSIWWN